MVKWLADQSNSPMGNGGHNSISARHNSPSSKPPAQKSSASALRDLESLYVAQRAQIQDQAAESPTPPACRGSSAFPAGGASSPAITLTFYHRPSPGSIDPRVLAIYWCGSEKSPGHSHKS